MEKSIKIANQNTLPSGGEGVGLREAARQFINANALQEKGLQRIQPPPWGKVGGGSLSFRFLPHQED